MKNAKFLAAIALLLSSFVFTRCTTEAGDTFDTSAEMLAHGTWGVDHYFSGTDQTAAYNTYQFSFSTSGKVSCMQSAEQCSGNWKVWQKVESEVLHLELSTLQSHLQVLNNEWAISTANTQSMTLKNGAAVLTLRRL